MPNKKEIPFDNEDDDPTESSKPSYQTLFEGNIFYQTKEGIKQHIKVTQESPTGVPTAFMGMLESLKVRIINDGGGADASFGGKSAVNAPRAAKKEASPMEQAASDVFPGAIEKECPNGCAGVMEYIPGTEVHGRTAKSGKPYSSFHKCRVCEKTVWVNAKKQG